jgi:SAM-dependent methyltransferase
MTEPQEHLGHDTSPALRAEAELRYAAVAELVAEAALWVDLGCGTGVAAADALAGGFAVSTLLVDRSSEALETASAELPRAETLQADLATPEGLDAVRAALAGEPEGPRVATCFETIPHLKDFAGLVGLLIELAAERGFTVVLSVPNDAFWGIENPFHHTMWGEGAAEELRRLLPEDHVVMRQVPLAGSALVPGAAESAPLPAAEADLRLAGVPSHVVVAFGPQAARLAPGGIVRGVDLDEQRRWERKRDSDLAFLEARVAELERSGG